MLLQSPLSVIAPDGAINWKAGLFEPDFNDAGILMFVIHRPTGHKAPVDEELRIDRTWKLDFNNDDLTAEFFRTKTHRHKCKDFFDAGQGPLKLAPLKGKATDFQTQATIVSNELKEE